MTSPSRSWPTAGEAYGAVLLAGYVLMLGLNLPGHLSLDSVVQLYEGRFDVRETWAPAFYSWVLGFFDEISPGAGLYVTASAFLTTGALLSYRRLRPRATWAAVVLAAAFVLTPTLLIYQGIVWKDVFFANLAVAGFACLAHAGRVWSGPRRPWLSLFGAMLAFAAAAQARQNGAVVILTGALALAWIAHARGGWRGALAWSLGGTVATLALYALLGVVSQIPGDTPDGGNARGMRVVAHYDIVGALAAQPDLPLARIEAANPDTAKALRVEGVALYSPERVDYLSMDVRNNLWLLSDEVVFSQWRDIVLHHPGAYLQHRWKAFFWVFATPRIDSCLPVHVGVTGPERLTSALQIPPVIEPSDQALYNYVTWFLDTPLYSHVFYALVAAACLALLLRRREPADIAIAAMLLAALGFAASFALISIACDYRYLYFLDLAAVCGLLYVALDPPLGRPRRRAP